MYCGKESNGVSISSRHAFSSAYLYATRRDYPTSHHIDEMDPMMKPSRQRSRLAGSGVTTEKLKTVFPSARAAASTTGKQKTMVTQSTSKNLKAASSTNQKKGKTPESKLITKYAPRKRVAETSSESSDEETGHRSSSTDSVQLKRFVAFVNNTVSETVQKSVDGCVRSFFEDTSKKIADLSVQMLSNECLLSKMYLDLIDKFAKQNQGSTRIFSRLGPRLPRKYQKTFYHSDRVDTNQSGDGGDEGEEEGDENDCPSEKEGSHTMQYNPVDADEDEEAADSPNEQSYFRQHKRHKRVSSSLSSSSSGSDIKTTVERRLKKKKVNEMLPLSPPPAPPLPLSTIAAVNKNLEVLHSKSRRSKQSSGAKADSRKRCKRLCPKCNGIRASTKGDTRSQIKACRCYCDDDEDESSTTVRSLSPLSVQEKVRLFNSLKSGRASSSRLKNTASKKGISGIALSRANMK